MIETIWCRKFVQSTAIRYGKIFKYVIKTKNKLSNIYLVGTIKG